MIYGKAKNGNHSRDWDHDEKNGVVEFTTPCIEFGPSLLAPASGSISKLNNVNIKLL